MGQLGVMLYLMLPVAVRAGRTGLLAIPLAGVGSCLLAAWAQGHRSRWYTVLRKILAAGFGVFLWYRLSLLWAGYLGYERFFPVAGLIVLALLCLGRGLKFRSGTVCTGQGLKFCSGTVCTGQGLKFCSGRLCHGQVPGCAELKSLWGKVIALFLALLLFLQIPNLELGYVFRFATSDSRGLWREAAVLFSLNVPFFLELGKKGPDRTGKNSTLWKKQLGLWSLFFLVFVVLTGTFRFPLLVQSETVFLDLGRSAVWRNKTPVRMEIPADVVLWVTVFFALWECADTLWEPLPRRKEGRSDRQQGTEEQRGKEEP